MSEHADLAVRTAALHTEVQQLRSKLGWVDDADLRTIEECNPGAAWLLSAAFGGGGQIYNGDTLRGVMLLLASLATLIGAGALEAPLLLILWLTINITGSAHAFWQARAVNRYLAARAEQQRHHASMQAPHPAYRLAASISYAAPGHAAPGPPAPGPAAPASAPSAPIAELRARLEKLAVLHASAVIDDNEHRERRLGLLSELTSLNVDSVDDLLFELLPLIRAGTLTREDVDFIKTLGGRR